MFSPGTSPPQDALRRASDDYLAEALRLQTSTSLAGASSLAFQAGYFALLSAVNGEVLVASDDHPNAEIVREVANQLSLSRADQNLADLGARNYYEPTSLDFLASPQDWIDWAERVRAAAGLSAGQR